MVNFIILIILGSIKLWDIIELVNRIEKISENKIIEDSLEPIY